ncbi:MAG: AgmX/PglI C-terminal domain-containing protein [Zetaproteobacteria bacterium]|nr:AgmX/PglI C-terminal domain-containing protein [Zetaproteobacteria bacterium]
MAKKNKRTKVYVSVLQNGAPVASTTHIVGRKRRKIQISSNEKDDLGLTLYPIFDPIQVVHIHRHQVEFVRETPWSGYIRSEGNTLYFRPNDRRLNSFRLRHGDYANLIWHDLRLMIRVAEETVEPKIKIDGKYRGNLGQHFFVSPEEVKAFAQGIAGAIGGMALVLVILSLMEPKRASKLEDLAHDFTLPFIHGASIVTAPEALQENYIRTDIVRSVIQFYRSVAQMYMGWDISNPELLFDSSKKRYTRIHMKEKDIFARVYDQQATLDQQASSNDTTRLLYVPSVAGADIFHKIEKIIENVDIMQKSFKTSLTQRRYTTLAFKHDPKYNWLDFTNPKFPVDVNLPSNKEVAERLSKINIFKGTDNEDLMYNEAALLAKKAEGKQKKLAKIYEQATISAYKTVSVQIPSSSPLVSFRPRKYWKISTEPTIEQLRAMEIQDKKRKNAKAVAEPVTGKINATAVRQLIRKNRFKLNLCYEMALRRNERLSGRMDWSWKISSKGILSELTLESATLKDRLMTRCIRNTIREWPFPHPQRGSVIIRHSFLFKPKGG